MDEYRNDRDRSALFEKLLALLENQRRRDPTLSTIDRQARAFSVSRNGHLFTYEQGSERQIGSGEVHLKPNLTEDVAHRIDVKRSITPDRFLLSNGLPATLDEIAAEIMSLFLAETETRG